MTALKIDSCRICGSTELTSFLDLGEHPMADAFVEPAKLDDLEFTAPLVVCACADCGLIQLRHVVPPAILYDESYVYESSITHMGQRHWTEFSLTSSDIADLSPGDLVVDIGSNVGVLLEKFRDCGATILGVDPAPTIAHIANGRGIETLEAVFDQKISEQVLASRGPAKIITATNVFAHIHDLHSLIQAVRTLMAEDGLFIVEAPYVPNMLRALEYDTIYHEHLSYLSLRPIMRLVEQYDLEVFDVQQHDIHGGSFRIFIRRAAGSGKISSVVDDLVRLEEAAGVYRLERLNRFAADVSEHRTKLLGMLNILKQGGRRIAGVSAPAKGMTLLNYCGIGPETLSYITEKSELKVGRYSPGSKIPIKPDSSLLEDAPDYALILAWNFAEEIMQNLKSYSQNGGKFIIPIPEPHIIG